MINSTSDYNYQVRRKKSGISRPSLLNGLPETHRFMVDRTFIGDLMHMANLNAGDLFVSLWRGTLQTLSSDCSDTWPWAVLTEEAWSEHGKMVAESRPYIPGSFDKAPRNIAEKLNSRYKAKEWQAYLYGLAPALLYGLLPSEYWHNFCKFVIAVRILHQRKITLEEVKKAQDLLNDFAIEFEEIYVQRRTDRIHMVRPFLHAILHGPSEILRVGPLGLLSTWTIE